MDAQTLARFQRRRDDDRAAAARRRAEAARAALPALVRLLVRDYGAREVVLFGSLAWGEPHAASDIDLAVLGVRGGDLWLALAACNDLAPVPVQLVPLESAAPSLVERVRAHGLVLHG